MIYDLLPVFRGQFVRLRKQIFIETIEKIKICV